MQEGKRRRQRRLPPRADGIALAEEQRHVERKDADRVEDDGERRVRLCARVLGGAALDGHLWHTGGLS